MCTIKTTVNKMADAIIKTQRDEEHLKRKGDKKMKNMKVPEGMIINYTDYNNSILHFIWLDENN